MKTTRAIMPIALAATILAGNAQAADSSYFFRPRPITLSNPVPTAALSGAALPKAAVGTPWRFDFSPLATLGNASAGKVSWSLATVPPGFSMDASTGVVSGTPSSAGTVSFDVTVANGGASARESYSLAVEGVEMAASAITAGYEHTCALDPTGDAYCWGNGSGGRLGTGDNASSNIPKKVVGIPAKLASIDAGAFHTCAVTVDGAAWCWGNGENGRLGNGATANSPVPVAVKNLGSGVARISAGGVGSCAVTVAGAALCWGHGTSGGLGQGKAESSSVPVGVSGLGSGVATADAGNGMGCALKTDGTVMCWGQNFYGELGAEHYQSNSLIPLKVKKIGVATLLNVGEGHACVIVSDGGVHCWGNGEYGQNGTGRKESLYAPEPLVGIGERVMSLDGSGSHTCGLTQTGRAVCWGSNYGGQLGNGASYQPVMPRALPSFPTGLKAVVAGGSASCAVLGDGTMRCVGSGGSGQLGNGTNTTTAYGPVTVVKPAN